MERASTVSTQTSAAGTSQKHEDTPPSSDTPASSQYVLGLRIDPHSPAKAADIITGWACRSSGAEGRARMVCAANVHMTMEAHDDPSFRRMINSADCVLPDGMPLAWALRLLGDSAAERVRMTPDLVLDVLSRCSQAGVRVGLYGGTDDSLEEMLHRLNARLPSLNVVYAYAPPFRPLTEEEDAAVVSAINRAEVTLLLVGIGCPKQERWMAEHRRRLDCVMMGVGAAFDLLAGRTTEAPGWMQRSGLEWVYRLSQDPRRLWRRYARHNPRFVGLLAAQLVRRRLDQRRAGFSAPEARTRGAERLQQTTRDSGSVHR